VTRPHSHLVDPPRQDELSTPDRSPAACASSNRAASSGYRRQATACRAGPRAANNRGWQDRQRGLQYRTHFVPNTRSINTVSGWAWTARTQSGCLRLATKKTLVRSSRCSFRQR